MTHQIRHFDISCGSWLCTLQRSPVVTTFGGHGLWRVAFSSMMKLRQWNVCQTCRTRKLGCDGKQPECGQCKLRGRNCQWETAAFTFVPQYPSQGNPVDGQTIAQPCRQTSWNDQARDPKWAISPQPKKELPELALLNTGPSCQDQVELIVKAFIPPEERPCDPIDSNDVPRICGAWVGVLPHLVRTSQTRDRALSLAIAAFSSCLTSSPNAESIQMYNSAVEAVRADISTQSRTLDAILIAAVMCLTLTEVFLPESSFGYSMHVYGVAQCFQAAGPAQFQSGVLHTLFAGFRPLLLLEAIRSRKTTFIATREWIDVPFSSHSPSIMQRLISYVASLPLLLQRSDSVLESPCESNLDEVSNLSSYYQELITGLERWEKSLQHTHPEGIWSCHLHPNQGILNPSESRLWFSDITMANVYTHIWAFRIICATELASLARSFPYICQQASLGTTHFSRDSKQTNEALAVSICRSMDYLLQADMKLFGSTSAVPPLHIAYNVLVEDEKKNTLYIAYIRHAFDRMVKQGIQDAPSNSYSRDQFG